MDRRGRLLLISSLLLILLSNLICVYLFFVFQGVIPFLLCALFLASVLLGWLTFEGYNSARYGLLLYLVGVYAVAYSHLDDYQRFHRDGVSIQLLFYVSVGLLVIAGLVLVFSRSIPEYMYYRRNG